MNNRKATIFISVFVFNLLISTFYFFEGLNYQYSDLSTDLHNIIPIIQKLDNPELFHKDLYLNSIENIEYYTPFFVESLQFLSGLVHQNYILGLNLFNAISHLVYGILWFYFFYKFSRNFWFSLLFSILVKGIVWLPGYEFWGISNLDLFLPRTLFFTLLPIPFLVLKKYTIFYILISGFLSGFIFNFHPISGLGGILLFLIFVIFKNYHATTQKLNLAKIIGVFLFSILLGMLPFLLTYFGNTNSEITYDISLFMSAFNERISIKFSNPVYYLKQWLALKYLFYYIPFVIYLILGLRNKTEKKRAQIILFSVSALLILPNISVYVEQMVNATFSTNFRMSFQLIRIQKLVIIPYYFSMFFLAIFIINNYKIIVKHQVIITSLFISSLFVCHLSFFDNVPFFGDDIVRTILPSNMSFKPDKIKTTNGLEKMAEYIKNETDSNAVIFGSHFYRVAAQRSVILDFKGASMLIEGNPKKLIDWYQTRSKLNSIKNKFDKIYFMKSLGVTLLVTKTKFDFLELLHHEGDILLYKLQ